LRGLLTLLCRLVTLAGQLPCADCAATAVGTAADVWPPDVVLLDLAMPGMSGYELARQLRQSCPDRLFLVCLSGYGTEADRRRSREAGFDYHLLKPADPKELHRLLESCRHALQC
jgi:CheY-like chemotaxis protein